MWRLEIRRPEGSAALLVAVLASSALPALGHPHVFVDGGVDFVMRDGTVLEALEVTWLYDPFETLYILASLGVSPDEDWRLQDEDRLQVTFRRDLVSPLDLSGIEAEIAFYEATYFYAFAVTEEPEVIGDPDLCAANAIPFDAELHLAKLQTTLAELGREETSEIEDVGALFADRIVLQCG